VAADQVAFLRAVRASRRLHRPWAYPADTPVRFAALLERPGTESYLIVRNEEDALAGTATLGNIVLGHLRAAYLGYEAFVPLDGRGT
jgi:ribosomal-protein-alanine N-acetyltransferase